MMATSVTDDLWTNDDKVNWLKGVRVMEITDETIRPFVETEITKFHNDIRSNFRHGSICGRCKSTNARYCSSSICSDITSHIESVHRYSPPCYKNSDITQWLSDPWEIAKCYMSRSKDLEGKPGSDIDFPSVLNVVINNTRFQSLITTVDMTNNNNVFCKGRNARNEVMHSRSHQMTAHALNHYCDIFIEIVNTIGTEKAECMGKIEKVRDTPVSITTEDIVKLKELAAGCQGLAERLKKDMREEIKKGKMESPDTPSPEDGLDEPTYDEMYFRIDKILGQIAENLDEPETFRLINILRTAVYMEPEDDDTKVEELIDEFTELTMSRMEISNKLIKQGVRSLIELKLDTTIATYQEDPIRHFYETMMLSIIADFGEMDEATLNKYLEIKDEGYEYVRHIRLMVVGMFGVGKTTIIRRLCNEGVSNVKSTVGIDVSVNACEVDDNNEWTVTDLEAKKNKYYESRFSHAQLNAKEPIEAIEIKSPESSDVEEQNEENIPKDVKVNTLPRESIKPKVEVPNPVKEKKPKAVMEPLRQNIKRLKESEPMAKEYIDNMKASLDEKKKLVKPERITTVSIWDFAGQSIYYSTIHFFLSARAIYLLVLNISQRLDAPVPEEVDNDGLDRATSMPKGFTCRDAFKFWMNSIYTYTTSRKDASKLYRPTIVLVGTFKDVVKKKYEEKCMKDEDFLEKYKEDYFNDALKSFADSEVIKLVHRKKFFVSRDDPAEVFGALKNELSSLGEEQPYWKEWVPMKWIPLERSMEIRKPVKQTTDASQNNTGSLTTNGSNAKGAEAIQSKSELQDGAGNKADDTDKTNENSALMELEELERIDRENEFSLADKKKIQIFLYFQHALGNVLYYDTKQLEDTIILDPQWILNVFKLFVAHAREREPTLWKEWENYEKNAILSLPLIDELVAQAEDTTFTGNKGKIIQYMEYFDVIAKPVIYQEDGEEDNSSSDEEVEKKSKQPWENKTKQFYIVPCLLSLKPSESELKCKTAQNAKSTPILCMVFKNDFLPASVCHRLMATCIRKWEVPPYKRTQLMVFNGMGRFLLNPGKTMWLSLWWKDNIIYLQIFLCTNKKKPVDGPKCAKVLQQVKQMIRGIFSIHRNFTGDVKANQETQYDEYIKCPKCVEDEAKVHVGSEGTELAPEENITEKSKMLCVKSFAKEGEVKCENDHTIGRDAALSQWFSETNEKLKIAKLRHLREGIFNWFRENPEGVEITELHLAQLSEHIGKEYTLLGIELGLNFQTIAKIDLEERDIQTHIKKILLGWKKVCQKTPTVGNIKSAILKVLGIYLKNGKYREEEISEQKIVKWFETKFETKLGTDMPTERELLEVANFVDGNYKKLRKPLSLSYPNIEQIEEMYSLDINRTLVVLLQWKQNNTNVSYNTLKDILVKMWKIDWEDVKAEIEKGKEDPTQQEDSDDDDDEEDVHNTIDPEESREIEEKRALFG